MCEDEPTVINGTTDWTSEKAWAVGASVEATCNTSLYVYPNITASQTLYCTHQGWTNATPCEEGAR